MVYMTFKIKRNWLFNTLLGTSAACNVLALIFLIVGAVNGITQLLVGSLFMFLALGAANGYVGFCVVKQYKIGLTKDSVKISDLSNVEIPYNKIRSIKKEREASKYGLYDALLVIKYNKYDSVKLNVHDLENVFDNLKEMVQKANLDKVVNSVVTKADGTKEIQQNIPTNADSSEAGKPVVTPAAKPAAKTTTTTTTAKAKEENTQPTSGALVKPAAKTTAAKTTAAKTTTTTTTTTTKTVKAAE